MIITTPDELRLFSPSNAVDNIDSLTGFINSSEQDFLREKLGGPLYASLVAYYNETIRINIDTYLSMLQGGTELPAYASLLYLCQKAVTYDALSRAVSLQAVSINGMGVNVAANDNYKAADRDAIADFKKGCVKEAHSAINELLQTLEGWAVAVGPEEDPEPENPDADADAPAVAAEDGDAPAIDKPAVDEPEPDPLEEEKEIVKLWRMSRYYYRFTTLLIPSAVVLQEYYNIYESREKFIQMVSDLRYIQEDIIAPIFGEEVTEYIVRSQWRPVGNADRHIRHITHNLRKIMVRYLEMRQVKSSDERHTEARNEAVKLTNRLTEYLQVHQPDLDEAFLEVFRTSPLYVAPPEPEEKPETSGPLFENNRRDSVMFVTPGLI